ncbi:hypothetical protein CLOM_g6168 [Closterium sp. NIES-68]|nr:hypothetical protein CLOM_g6168 [Closterium sp. NIES-68]
MQGFASRRSRQPAPSSSSSLAFLARFFSLFPALRRPSVRHSLILLGALLLLARHLSHRTSPHARKLQAQLSPHLPASATAAATATGGTAATFSAAGGSNSANPADSAGSALENSAAGGGRESGAAERRGSAESDGAGRSEAAGGGEEAQGAGMVRLWNGVMMPRVGFGTAGLGDETAQAVEWALEAGYRLFDSAQAREWYREDAVGAAIARHNVSRNDLFLVSKLHPRHHGYAITRERFADSLRDLRVRHLDLFLLHYPFCFPAICGGNMPQGGAGGGGVGGGGAGGWLDSWRALEDLYQRGAVRAIGVSNFGREELLELIAQAEVKPHVLQRNSDPLRADTDLQTLCAQHGIAYMAYSSLGSQHLLFSDSSRNPVLAHPTITAIAARRACSSAQVVLKWGLLKGQVVIPRSRNRVHIRENFEAWRCGLGEGDVAEIDKLDGTMDGAG